MAIIGREGSADIVLPFNQVSARHAFIEPIGAGRYRIVDLGSSNGTYVSGHRVQAVELRQGEDVRLGTVQFNWTAALPTLNVEASLPAGLTLGREATCDIVINDSRVSARHLRIVPDGPRFRILDLGSRNGLSVNGQPVSQAVVGAKDRVMLGSLPVDVAALIVQRSRPAAPAPCLPPLWFPPAPEPPQAPPPPPRPSPHVWIWALAGVVVLGLGIAAFLYGTRETLVRKCEIDGCTREVFHETAFIFQVDDARRRMQAAEPWCETHAAEPVPYKRTVFCRICGKEISSVVLTAPRRERHADEQDHTGLCEQNSCKTAAAYQQLKDDVGDAIDKGADMVGQAAGKIFNQLIKD